MPLTSLRPSLPTATPPGTLVFVVRADPLVWSGFHIEELHLEYLAERIGWAYFAEGGWAHHGHCFLSHRAAKRAVGEWRRLAAWRQAS